MKKTVAVIFGGRGYESDISIKSAEHVIENLDKRHFTTLPVFIDTDGAFKIIEPRLAHHGAKSAPEAYPVYLDGESGFLVLDRVIPVRLAILALHGNFGEDGVVQGALECAKIKTLGQSVLTSALTNDKAATKTVADKLKIKNAEWVLLTNQSASLAEKEMGSRLDYPIFLKAASFGSSYGSFKVENREEFLARYEKIRNMGETRIIAEELIVCDYELECAYIELSEEHFFPCGIIHSKGRFYSPEEKYKSDSSFTPSLEEAPKSVKEAAIRISRELKNALEVRYLARFDFFVSGTDIIFNEVNTFPGMTATSLYPKIIEEKLCPFTDALTALIERAER